MSVNKYIYWYSIILFPFILKKWKQHWMKRSICFCLVQVLLGITSRGSDLKFFHPRNLLPTECLTVIIDIMRETGEIKPSLIIKCLQLLRNLGKIGYHEDCRPYFSKKKSDVKVTTIMYAAKFYYQVLVLLSQSILH